MIYRAFFLKLNICYFCVAPFFYQLNGENWFHQYGNTKENVFQSIAAIPDSGYVLLGYSNTLGNGQSDLWVVRLDQDLNFLWQRYYGGPNNEVGKKIIFHHNSLFVIGEKDVQKNKDVWILRLDLNGKELWSKEYGGEYDDFAHSIEIINDQNLFITGVKTTAEKRQQGLAIVLKPEGEIIWENNFGGVGNDGFYHGIQSSDDGFLVVGYTNSLKKSGLKAPKISFLTKVRRMFTTPKPSQEIWVSRMDKNGNKVWDMTYGGSNIETGKFIYENGDSSIIIMGNTNSFSKKNDDIWVIRTNKDGYEISNKKFGGKGKEDLKSIIILQDKKIMLSVSSNSSNKFFKKENKNYHTSQILISNKGEYLSENRLYNNYMSEINAIISSDKNTILNVGYALIDKRANNKIVSSKWKGFSEKTISPFIKKGWFFEAEFKGNKKIEKFYNGENNESVIKSVVSNQSNIIILATINALNKNQEDMIVLIFDSFGNLKETQTYYDVISQYGKSFYEKSDGGIIVIGDKKSINYLGMDLFVKSLKANGEILWENEYGFLGNDIGFDVIESSFGTIIVGKTNSFGSGGDDGWLIGITRLGNEKWSKTYGGVGYDNFSSITSIGDGNYIVTGTKSSGLNGDDIWVMSIDDNGDDLWMKTYGNNLNEKGIQTVIAKDEDMVTLGVYQNNIEGMGDDIMVLKTNSLGIEKWSKIFARENDQIPVSICELKNGSGYVIIGGNKTDALGIQSILLIRVNNTGNIVWEKTFGESYHSKGVSVFDDGTGLVISGDIDLDSNGNSDIFLLKMDYAGTIMKN